MNDDDHKAKQGFPQSLISKVYDHTGDSMSTRGFILLYVSREGTPVMVHKTSNEIIAMGLVNYLDDFVEGGGRIKLFDNIPDEEEDLEDGDDII